MTYTFKLVGNLDIMPRMPEIIQAVARSVSNAVKANLVRKDQNSRPDEGMPKSGYYGQAANAVTTTVNGNEATINIPKEGVRLHFYGGTVRPGEGKKALAIPKDPKTAGMRAMEYDPTRQKMALVWPEGSSVGFLVDKKTRKGGRKIDYGKLMYLLVPKATIRADRTILPHEGAIRKAIDEAMEAVKL